MNSFKRKSSSVLVLTLLIFAVLGPALTVFIPVVRSEDNLIDSYNQTNQDSYVKIDAFYWNNITGYAAVGQTFNMSSPNATIGSAQFYLKKTGNPTVDLYAVLYEHAGEFGTSGIPFINALASSIPVNSSSLSSSFELTTFTFREHAYLIEGKKYCIAVQTASAGGRINASNYVNVALDFSNSSHEGNYFAYDGRWTANPEGPGDLCYSVYFAFAVGGAGGDTSFSLSFITIPITVYTSIYYFMWLFLSFVHVSKKDEPLIEPKFNPHPPMVSVLLPCRNEEAVIGTVIQQCLDQTHKNLEIIVVAHNCTDNTAEVARQFNDPRVKVYELNTEDVGKGLGLNYGAKFAQGEIIIYFDSDSIISKDYIEKVVDLMVSKGYEVVQGKIVGSNPGYNKLCFLQHLENQIFLSMFWGGKQKVGLPAGLGGTGVSIKRSALDKIGGFRNILIEDFDLCVRAQVAGQRVGYCQEAVVYDEKVPKYNMLIRQRSRWMAGHVQLIVSMIKEKTLGKLFIKNPVDFFQLFSPVYTLCLWLGVFVGIVTTLQNQAHLFSSGWISFFYVPLIFFLVQTLALQLLFVLILRRECTTKEEFRKSVLNLPLFYIYSMHWFWVLLRLVVYRNKITWAHTKTEHGFRRK